MAPLTWPGVPRSSCSGTAGCRKETGSLPISFWPPFLPCSPPACLRSKLGQNTSPCGSNCGRQEKQTKMPWVINNAARWPFLSFYSLFLFTSTLSLLPGKKTQACILSSFLYFCSERRTSSRSVGIWQNKMCHIAVFSKNKRLMQMKYIEHYFRE